MSYRFVTLDVFTEARFEGNPLAIVHVPANSALTQDQKQAIAREFNLSETVFLHEDDRSAARRLDIFLPTVEIPFAGHPVIGALCHIGATDSPAQSRDISLRVRAGTVAARFDGRTGRASAQIPHEVRVHRQRVSASFLATAQPVLCARLAESAQPAVAYPVVSIVRGMAFALVELPALEPHLAAVAVTRQALPESAHPEDADWPGPRGCMFFVRLLPDERGGGGGEGGGAAAALHTRLRTRMVSRHVGEDPATGSASSALAAYLALQDGRAGQEYEFEMEQGVEMGRRSCISVTVTLGRDEQTVEKVVLGGKSVLVQEGVIKV